MKKVLVSDPLPDSALTELRRYSIVDVKTGASANELRAIIGEYDALIVRSQTQVTADIIEAGKKLQIIGRAGVGVDNIDLDAATERGIIVVNSPTGNTTSAAEHSFALMMALARHIPNANASLKSGKWERSKFVGSEVRHKTIGIVGLGNVGAEVARMALGMDMNILGYDPFISADKAERLHIKTVTLEELFKNSDFITLHIPLLDSTRGLIGKKQLDMMKDGVRIINAARGGLIDDQALLEALQSGKVGGAAIDVFEVEPCTDSILFQSDKVIATPHLGASTKEAQDMASTQVLDQIIDVFNGKPARFSVNAPRVPADAMAVITPYFTVANAAGIIASHFGKGQVKEIVIKYEGELSKHDSKALKAMVLSAMLNRITEEKASTVNAEKMVANRGIKVIEQKVDEVDDYEGLLTVEMHTTEGIVTVSATMMRNEPHVVRINDFWLDFVPQSSGNFLFVEHKDQPGLVGAVGRITGESNINISHMLLARLEPRGRALMIMTLDEIVAEDQRQRILQLPDIKSAMSMKF
ncbi:MAG: phosphoglycerate dehydrogenase [Chloroflexi bacterium]|nr:phosphoglycerate dehydrogenase [Chloroflexota bacterium]